jgi:hypothetical protein
VLAAIGQARATCSTSVSGRARLRALDGHRVGVDVALTDCILQQTVAAD